MEMSYKLVSESEANLKEKKVSIGSPLGQGLLGKQVGEIAQINTPNGLIDFEIIDISF
jgi:transcription elongation factor GreA